jgi:serine/threonine protein kinase
MQQRRLGRYRVIRRIGTGGAGEVYLAEMEGANGFRRLSALKVLRQIGGGPTQRASLLREARLAASLSHPNLVTVWEVGVDDDVAWLAMEFVSGRSLLEVLAETGNGIPPLIAARIVADACAGVHALHEAVDERGRSLSVVHRDVSPHNVLLSWAGVVKVVDLGLARSVCSDSVTTSGIVKGKLGYLSPEQASGGPLDRRCDVYALGVLLWEAVTGRRLFRGTTDSETLALILGGRVPPLLELSPQLPAGLAQVVARALAVHPADRYASAREMQRELEGTIARVGCGIGSDDLAALMAGLFPDQVREHEGWLRSEDRHDSALRQEERTSGLSGLAIGEASPRIVRRASSRLFRLGAAMGTALSAAALAVLLGWPPFHVRVRPPEGADRGGRSEGYVPPIEPYASTPARSSVEPPGLPPVEGTGTDPIVGQSTRSRGAPPTIGHRRQPSQPQSRRPAEPPAAPATLNIVALPTWATIRLDGKDAGATPLVLREVAPGRHVVDAISLGSGPRETRTILLEPASVTRVEFQFP